MDLKASSVHRGAEGMKKRFTSDRHLIVRSICEVN